ncbi:MAG: hypothetical protein PHH59_06350 [Methylovulum sp.]|uniref:hypothetical protein n=1 Tax=Methylovulum sp. TaxID=1916980 RepID=UPI002620587E|nr:hypothetical protein [Methylovulum sp.]MDD2723626.1 hypothetical protein [Methylovulum sp.]MDD5124309.1 hypothetical protein [Methylovulum sp.]
MNDDDWTPEEIAFAAARQAEITATTQYDEALLGLKKSKKPPFVYIFIRFLIGLIPPFAILSSWHISSGFEVIAEYIQLFGLLLLSSCFYFCYLFLWVCKVNLIPSLFYSACIVGGVILLFVMTQS